MGEPLCIEEQSVHIPNNRIEFHVPLLAKKARNSNRLRDFRGILKAYERHDNSVGRSSEEMIPKTGRPSSFLKILEKFVL